MQNSIKQRPALRSGLWFLAVGGAAALTHFAVFQWASDIVWADVANVAGFIVAFWVSFFGHRWLSFRGAGTTVGQSLRRFAVIAALGLASNQLVFELCWRWLHWPSSLAWFAAAALAAGQTWLLSRFWAFRR